MGLAFPQPDSIPDSNGTSHCVATSLYSKAQLSAPAEGERWPLVIRLETALEDKSEGKTLADLQEGSSQPLWIQSQTTFATLEQDPNGNWKAKVQKQKIWVAGVSYELQVPLRLPFAANVFPAHRNTNPRNARLCRFRFSVILLL